MKRYKFLSLLVIVTCFCSCNDWLDVSPITSKKADELFSTEQGFQKALTGIYIEMGDPVLYGENLTLATLDVMAQNYSSPKQEYNHRYEKYAKYDYKDSGVENNFNNIWDKLYNLISNCNGILDEIDDKKDVFTGDNYEIVKSEALALRGLFHFDLLRLYAPAILNEEDFEKEAIPYRIHISPNPAENKTSKQIIQYVIRDLKEAIDSLKIVDPIINTESESNEFESRRIKLNYYAVQGLLARVYLYAGLKDKAYQCALEVHSAQKFAITNIDEYKPSDTKSLTLTSEHLFNIFANNLDEDYVNGLFLEEPLGGKLALNTKKLETYYGKDAGETDLRLSIWFENTTTAYSKIIKYKQGEYIPIIKYAEILLILAETAPTNIESTIYFNELISARGLPYKDLDFFTKDDRIENEYRREFISEGQMFFYYKRKNKKYLPNDVVIEDTEKVYNLPIPLKEVEFNN